MPLSGLSYSADNGRQKPKMLPANGSVIIHNNELIIRPKANKSIKQLNFDAKFPMISRFDFVRTAVPLHQLKGNGSFFTTKRRE